MRKFLLVYNPLSGDASFKYKLDSVIHGFQARQCIIIPYKINNQEKDTKFLQILKVVQVDGIVVAGGDGTIHEVINIIMRKGIDIPLGLLPTGTSNDFAGYLQLDKSIEKCIETIVDGTSHCIDIGRVNDQYFFNVASAGLLTSAAHNADVMLKNTLGKIAYYLKGLGELPNFRALPMKMTIDDQYIEEDVFLFVVANSRAVGGFPNIASRAAIADGLLDILVVKRCGLPDLMSLFINILKGTHHNSKHIIYMQAKKMYIECEDELESDVDGEKGPVLPLTIEVIPNKIKILGCGTSL